MNQKVFILSTVVKYSVYAMTKYTNIIQIYITLQTSQSLVIFLCNARVQLHRQRFRVQKLRPLFVPLFDRCAGVVRTVEGPCLQQGNFLMNSYSAPGSISSTRKIVLEKASVLGKIK